MVKLLVVNTSDVAYALNLDLDAISKRLHHSDGPHLQDVETILYALHSLREYVDPPAMRAYSTFNCTYGQDADTTQAIHDDHLQNRTGG